MYDSFIVVACSTNVGSRVSRILLLCLFFGLDKRYRPKMHNIQLQNAAYRRRRYCVFLVGKRAFWACSVDKMVLVSTAVLTSRVRVGGRAAFIANNTELFRALNRLVVELLGPSLVTFYVEECIKVYLKIVTL